MLHERERKQCIKVKPECVSVVTTTKKQKTVFLTNFIIIYKKINI